MPLCWLVNVTRGRHLVTQALLLLLALSEQLYSSLLCYFGLNVALHPGSFLDEPLLYSLSHRIRLYRFLESCLYLSGTGSYQQLVHV